MNVVKLLVTEKQLYRGTQRPPIIVPLLAYTMMNWAFIHISLLAVDKNKFPKSYETLILMISCYREW